MRFIVYGAGAVGGAIGGRMFQHGHDVTLIARGSHYDALRTGGLRLVDAEHDVTLPIPTVPGPGNIDWRADDVVILGMKTQDTEAALRELAAVAPPTIAVACAQNGVENERLALRHVADVYAICVMLPASHLEPGVVEASSIPTTGLLDLGRYPGGLDDRAKSIAAALASSTFESIPRPDVMRWKYCKLLMNLANAAQALCGNGDPDVGELARRARSEAAAVLRAANIDAASRDEDRERRGDRLKPTPIAGAHRSGGSSWQSLQRGTGTIETDYLNGEIVALGRRHGVATPTNELLQRRANDAARRKLPPGSVTAKDLLDALPGQ
jgi:2-dehydropantoate 2-reductase